MVWFREICDVVQTIERVNAVYTELSAQNLNPRTNRRPQPHAPQGKSDSACQGSFS